MKTTHKVLRYLITSLFIFSLIICSIAFTMPQQKTYKLDLSTQEVQIIYDALGEMPAKTSEGIRAKIAKQVNEQNTTK